MKDVVIAGVRFIQHEDGRFELNDKNAAVLPMGQKYISYACFPRHNDAFSTTYVMGEWAWNGCQKFHRSQAQNVFTRFSVPPRYQKDIMEQFDKYVPGEDTLDPTLMHDEQYNSMASLCGLTLGVFTQQYCNGVFEFSPDDSGIDNIIKLFSTHENFPQNLNDYIPDNVIMRNIEKFKSIPDFELSFDVRLELEQDVNKKVLMHLEQHRDMEYFLNEHHHSVSMETVQHVFETMNSVEHFSSCGQDSNVYRLVCNILLDNGKDFTEDEIAHISNKMDGYGEEEILLARCGCDVTDFDDVDVDDWLDSMVGLFIAPKVTKVTLKALYREMSRGCYDYPQILKLFATLHPDVVDD